MKDFLDEISRLRAALDECYAVLVGAGSGLSASAGYTYTGERYKKYFGDFEEKYGIGDMYSGCFYDFATPGELWAWWSRVIYFNRYVPVPGTAYSDLRRLLGGREYFVITTNVDHCFQKAGFDKERLFYTQGDYGLWQCSVPCHGFTYDNMETVLEMMASQGFALSSGGIYEAPQGKPILTAVPDILVPRCPVCGRSMAMNLRSDSTFVEDGGWQTAADRYLAFVREHMEGRVLYLELGVGSNTPAIIKYPFWQLTMKNPSAVYACLNLTDTYCPPEIRDRAVCIKDDISRVLHVLL